MEEVEDPALVLGVMIGAVVGSAMRLLVNLTVCLYLVEVQTNCGKTQSSRIQTLRPICSIKSVPACLDGIFIKILIGIAVEV